MTRTKDDAWPPTIERRIDDALAMSTSRGGACPYCVIVYSAEDEAKARKHLATKRGKGAKAITIKLEEKKRGST